MVVSPGAGSACFPARISQNEFRRAWNGIVTAGFRRVSGGRAMSRFARISVHGFLPGGVLIGRRLSWMVASAARTRCRPAAFGLHQEATLSVDGRVIAGAFALAAMGNGAGAAMAQPSQAWTRCVDEDRQATPDQQISACTSVIQSGGRSPGDLAVVFRSRGGGHARQGQYDRAIADFNEALRLDPSDDRARYNRGLAYALSGEHDRAIADFNELLQRDPKDAVSLQNRGIAYAGKGQFDRAFADFNEAIRLNPNDPKAFSNRGFAHRLSGQYELAVRDYDQVLKLVPDSHVTYYNRGRSYEGRRDYAQAIADYDEAIRRDPKDSDYWSARCSARAK